MLLNCGHVWELHRTAEVIKLQLQAGRFLKAELATGHGVSEASAEPREIFSQGYSDLVGVGASHPDGVEQVFQSMGHRPQVECHFPRH